MQILDLDRISTWSPWITKIVKNIDGDKILEKLKNSSPEYLEDARDIFINEFDISELVSILNHDFSEFHIRVFHGTRLTDEETENIKLHGLRPLTLSERRGKLISIFEHHPRWTEVKNKIDDVLYQIGPGWKTTGNGKREDNCVHACLSRSGLLFGCNHYLTHGAEVDGHVAYALFGDDRESLDLLKSARQPKLVSFCVEWEDAARAANPYGFLQLGVPPLMDEFLKAWAFKLAYPDYEPSRSRNGTALRFENGIPAERIMIEHLTDDNLVR